MVDMWQNIEQMQKLDTLSTEWCRGGSAVQKRCIVEKSTCRNGNKKHSWWLPLQHTFTKYSKAYFPVSWSGAVFNKSLLKSIHRHSACKKVAECPVLSRSQSGACCTSDPFCVVAWEEHMTLWRKWRLRYIAKGVMGGCNGSVQEWNGKYQKLPFRTMRGRNLKEVTVGHWQSALISYLAMLSVTLLDGQESSLTWMAYVSLNRHSFMYITSLCSLSLCHSKSHCSRSLVF